jgi:hypothetical protein
MDTSHARSLANIDPNDLEVVGFNGTPRVECGRDLAIVRQRSTDRYSRLVDGVPPPAHTREEIDAFESQGRLTLLPKPINLSRMKDFRRSGMRLAEVVWYKDSFLAELGVIEPPKYPGVLQDWQPVAGGNYRAACASGAGAPGLLNLWGRELLNKSERLLPARSDDMWTKIKKLADLGLCASIESRLRYEHYLRYAAAQWVIASPDHARRTFDCFIHREFPQVSWREFETAVKLFSHERPFCLPPSDQLTGIATVHAFKVPVY